MVRNSVWYRSLVSLLVLGVVVIDPSRVAYAATGNLLPPFDTGERWYICQGYNQPAITHHNNSSIPSLYALDLVGGPNCENSAMGRNARTPLPGTVLYYSGSGASGSLCINANDGRSITLTHINSSLSAGSSVNAGQIVGTVAGPATANGNVAHIHLQIWSSHGCWGTGNGGVPFDTAHNARICGAPDLTSGGPTTGGNGEWSGTSFTGESCSPLTTFQSNTAYLYSYDGVNAIDTTKGMSSGSSPSTARMANGEYVTAFRTNTGVLYVYNHSTQSSTVTSQGIAAGTGPAITGFDGSGWQVVFQGSDGDLHGYDSGGTAVNYLQGMKSGTSPAMTALKTDGWRVVFQANTGNLYVYSVTGGGSSSTNLGQGMSATTSPAVTALSGSTWVASFQANTGVAYVYSSAVGSGQSLGINMASNTNPAIAGVSPSTYTVMVQHTSGNMWRYQNGATTADTNKGMKAGTSPTVRRTASNVYYAAFQANTGELHYYTEAGGSVATGQGMASATSPSLGLEFPVE